MGQIVRTRTISGIMYGLAGILLGAALFIAVTFLGYSFSYRNLHIPDWICQVAGVLFVLGSLFLIFNKSDVCSGCGKEIKDLRIYYKPGSENDIRSAFDRDDFHSMIGLPGQMDYLDHALMVEYGGCPGCGEAAYVELWRNEEKESRKTLEGDAARSLSLKVVQRVAEYES